MMTRYAVIAALAACAIGCAGSGPSVDGGGDAAVQPLTVQTVQWNPTDASIGDVTAVVEDNSLVIAFGDHGMNVFAGGSQAASDTTVTTWQSAAIIPAGDGAGTWVVAVDAMGQLWRLRAEMTVENIGSRYGLAGEHVHGVAPLGGTNVLFALDHGVAIADGMTVTRIDDASFATQLAGGGGRAVGATADMVRVLQVTPQQGEVSFPIAGVTAVAFDSFGRLVVATPHVLYAEGAHGALAPVYQSTDATIHGLAVSGVRTWFGVGSELGALQNGVVALTNAPLIDASAQLFGSPSGDVWVLTAGRLSRYSGGGNVSPDEARWDSTIVPVFARTCSQCHRPGGSSGVDLSTYASWVTRRAVIHQRVIVMRNMPPAGTTLPDADRTAIDTWTNGM